jgi:4-hydroxyphenylacetate 3-monooxygenase
MPCVRDDMKPERAIMMPTSEQYRASIRKLHRVWINGERVADVTVHPMFRPLLDIRSRIHDTAHEAGTPRR